MSRVPSRLCRVAQPPLAGLRSACLCAVASAGPGKRCVALAGQLILLVLSCLVLSGCVFREYTITTSPPGAIVQVNGKTVGPTPVDVPFIHYGTYRITIFRDGYQTLTVDQPVPAPWYEWFPFEFVSEQLVPWTIPDQRRFHFDLQPLQVTPASAIQMRAEEIRQQGHGIGVPVAPGVVPDKRPANDSLETLPAPNPAPPGNAAPTTSGAGPNNSVPVNGGTPAPWLPPGNAANAAAQGNAAGVTPVPVFPTPGPALPPPIPPLPPNPSY